MEFPHSIKSLGRPKHSPFEPVYGAFERVRDALATAWLEIEVRLPLFGGVPSRPGINLGGILRRFEDAAWFLRKKVLWGLLDRFSGLDPRGRILAAGGAALAAGVVVAALAIAVSSSGSPASTANAPVAVAKTATAPAPEIEVVAPPVTKPKAPPAPTLHGAAPLFISPQAKAKAKAGGAKADAAKPGTVHAAAQPKKATAPATTEKAIKPANTPAATAKIGATPSASATASNADAATNQAAGAEETAAGKATVGGATELDGPPAGPKAIKVARDFAGAFVVYETGGIDGTVRRTFSHSAIPALSHSLLKRPPRLPANVKVPRAKVVNVVPGPSQGKVYTVSVSLLRVGVTSELRLEMEQRKHHGWLVTNVLG